MVLLRLIGSVMAAAFWVVAGVVAMVLVTMVVAACLVPLPFGPFGALMVLVAAAVTVQALRRRRGAAVLHHLGQCVRLNLPLPRMLAAAQIGEGWALRARLTRLREALIEGEPIDEALRRHVPEVEDRAVALIGAAVQTGQLASALQQLNEADRRDRRADQSERIVAYVYQLMVLIVTGTILTGVMVFIMPQYVEIFEDFDVELPWMTLMLMDISMDVGGGLMFGAGAIALAVAGRATWTLFHGRPGARLMAPALADPVIWHVPLFGGMARDRGLSDACQTIARSLDAGLPLERAVDEAASLEISTVLRRRLRRLVSALCEGHALREAMRRTRLPRLMRGMVATVEAGSDAEPVFAFLHRYYAGRYERMAAAVRAVVWPMCILLLAGLVGFVAYALFSPLVVLIWANTYFFDMGL